MVIRSKKKKQEVEEIEEEEEEDIEEDEEEEEEEEEKEEVKTQIISDTQFLNYRLDELEKKLDVIINYLTAQSNFKKAKGLK